jgi:hypothetical protein
VLSGAEALLIDKAYYLLSPDHTGGITIMSECSGQRSASSRQRKSFRSIVAILFTVATLGWLQPAQGSATDTLSKRYELSLYGTMNSWANNLSAELDATFGWNLSSRVNLGLSLDGGFRNNALMNKELLSISFRQIIQRHEFRLGATGGIDSRLYGNWSTTIPAVGGELSYAYRLSPQVSLCVKERVLDCFEAGNPVVATVFLAGFCFCF